MTEAGATPRIGFMGWGPHSQGLYELIAAAHPEAARKALHLPGSAGPPAPAALVPTHSVEALFNAADWLFIEGAPANWAPQLHTMRLAISDRHVLVALGGGWSLETLLSHLHERKVLRCLLLAAGTGAFRAVAYHAAPFVPEQDRAAFGTLLGGPELMLPLAEEAHFDVVEALAGFAPAAFYTILDSMADGVLMMGIRREDAVQLLAALVREGMTPVLERRASPAQLREQALEGEVAATGLMALETAGLRGHVMQAIHAAVDRARERQRRLSPKEDERS